MISANHSPLKKQISDRVVEPAGAARLHPDTGIAHKSTGFSKYSPGTTNAVANKGFWESLGDFFTGIEQKLFSFAGLKGDEIIVDIYARTPNGNGIIPNVRLNVNNFHGGANEVVDRLNKGQALQVKITYDGGRATECTPISWVFDFPSAQRIKAETDWNAAQSGSGNIGGSWGMDDTSVPIQQGPDISLTAVLGNPKGAKAAFLSDRAPWKGLVSVINAAANQWGLDANLLAAVIMTESSGNVNTPDSSAGGMGAMQMIPSTYREQYSIVSKIVKGLIDDPHDGQTSIVVGSHYLAQTIAGQGNDIKLGLAAYNAGPGNVAKYHGIPPFPETQKYIVQVCGTGGLWEQFHTRSVTLAQAKSAQRLEEVHTDQTSGSANTSYGVVGGGTV